MTAIIAILLMRCLTLAHNGEMHHEMHNNDSRMVALHRMMPMFALARAKIVEAIEKRDAAKVKAETGKILAAMPDLKRAQPHKNLGNIKEMRRIATSFEANLVKTASVVDRRDFVKAKTYFGKAAKQCDECHRIFKD